MELEAPSPGDGFPSLTRLRWEIVWQNPLRWQPLRIARSTEFLRMKGALWIWQLRTDNAPSWPGNITRISPSDASSARNLLPTSTPSMPLLAWPTILQTKGTTYPMILATVNSGS
ncbi:hypothetical protein MPNT_190057 [Candidatus Methylacidithermus pantelleriae]|uniref:Uncharacterized protein n=1 Tax=Candidatus Methylacidithermus pantelleriae TaxID=2744239 RepID=A0A8J2BSK6_9BACT|nr:hypothetical protein MPNT_190057 [Candidatus Methylacidithermus pantelleriae]